MGQGAAADPTAGEHSLAIIEHGGLARGHGACRSIEDEVGFSGASSRVEGCRDRQLC
jgi:hypothetical protein